MTDRVLRNYINEGTQNCKIIYVGDHCRGVDGVLTLGGIGETVTHDAIAEAVLREAERDHPAATIVPLPFRWEHDDLRALQLRKQAL